jgi:TatD DNase family protein
MWIDSHCHLNHPNIKEEGTPADIIARAFADQTNGLVTICCRIAQEEQQLKSITEAHNNVWCTIGTHPHDAGEPDEKALTADDIIKATAHPKVIGIGETGLDYFYDNSPRPDQKASFEKHLQACLATDLPVIIHARDADNDIAEILESHSNGGKLKGVMHCFSSGAELAKRALDIGFYVSFSGIITFGEKADDLRAIAKTIPLDRLLVETDAPFLAPKPHRGRTNTPAFVKHTGEKLAEIHGITPEEMAKITTANFFNLFKKAAA